MTYRSALKVTTASQVVMFALSLLSVVVVSRLLTPFEIGVFSVSVSLLGFAHVFREFGVGQYLVQSLEVHKQHFRASFTVALAFSWGIGVVVALLAYPMSRLYEHPGVSEVLLLASLNFIAMPFGTPSLAMLRRELQFGRIATVNVIGALVQAAVTIGAAYGGQSYLSMAWGTLAMQVCKVLLLQFLRPGEIWVLPTLQGLREVLRFGSLSTGAHVVGTLSQSAPDLVLGKTLGFADVAYLSRGMSLTAMLVEKIHETVRSVFFPIFANRLRSGASAASQYVETASNLTAVTAPLLALLAVAADPLLPLVFGERWMPSTHIASVLCLSQLASAPFALYAAALTAAGAVGTVARVEIAAAAAKICLLSSSLWYGLDVVIYFIAAGYLIESVLAARALRSVLNLPLRRLASGLWKGYALAAATGCVALAAGLVSEAPVGSGWIERCVELAAVACAGLITWIGGVVVLRHPLRMEAARLLRKRHA